MENRYHTEAACNTPGRKVYGFRLKPFCLEYLHLLQSIDSPLLHANKPFNAADLLLAAEICCSTWNNEGYTLDRILRPGIFRRRRNQLRLATCRFLTQVDIWRDYYQDFLVEAEKWEEVEFEERDEFGGLIRSHKSFGRKDLDRVLAIASAVIVPSGWDEEKVMMMPIGRAIYWSEYFAIQGGNDKIKFKTAVEEAIEAALEKRMAEEAEKQKGATNGKPEAQ